MDKPKRVALSTEDYEKLRAIAKEIRITGASATISYMIYRYGDQVVQDTKTIGGQGIKAAFIQEKFEDPLNPFAQASKLEY